MRFAASVILSVISAGLLACTADTSPHNGSGGLAVDGRPDALGEGGCTRTDGSARDDRPLQIRFHGVMGFSLRRGDDLILTAPMLSNPSLDKVLLSTVQSDPVVVDRFLPTAWVDGAQAILVGHAHYDHLLDVPHAYTRTGRALIYGNMTTKHILAGAAPDRAADCPLTLSAPQVPRDRVVALNDPGQDLVDRRLCGSRKACTGIRHGDGAWVPVPGSRVRIRALCSSHPPQFFSFHFGAGCVKKDLCRLPAKADGWLEGETLAYLIDFLDPQTGAPAFRVYYQDAPTDAPVGHVPGDLLEEKRVDVALLCTGAYDQVVDHPARIIAGLKPRYVIAGHWEDFFHTQGEPIRPLPFIDLQPFLDGLKEVEKIGGAEHPVLVNHVPQNLRHWLPLPGTEFELGRADGP